MKKRIRTLLKVAGGFVIVVVIAGASIWKGGWGSIEASHPSLVSQKLPPLIPIRDFFANSAGVWGYAISPDGKWMSWKVVDGTKSVVKVAPVGDLSNARTVYVPQGAAYSWHPDSIGLLVTRGNYYTGIEVYFADIRPDSFAAKPAQWKNITPPSTKRWALNVRSGNDPWLVISDDRIAGRSDIYTIAADGVGKTEYRRNDGNIAQWYLNRNNDVVGRVVKRDETTYAIEADRDGDNRNWQALGTFSVFDIFVPLILNDDHWIAVSDRGRNYAAIVRIDLDTGKESVLYENASRSITNAFTLSQSNRNVDYLLLGGGEPEYVAMSDRGEKLLSAMGDIAKPFEFNILSASEDGSKITVAISERENSWFYRLVDLKSGEITALGEYDMRRYKDDLADTQFMKIKARDGLEIPVLLTLPKGIEAKNLPMVVLAHGGPASHVPWGYNHEAQFLANRGYAVLSVNYRGSTGFGKASQKAGYRQFGRKMQDDFIDSAQAMIDRGIADKDKIAIYGSSMGGYSAMMGVARDPDFYAAGISFAGVSDWVADMKTMPVAWFADIAYVTKYFGDPKNPDDVEAMRQNSPLTLVDQVKAPMLIGHGEPDPIVAVEQSRLFVAGLTRNKVEHEAVYYPDEGHGISKWQNQIEWNRRLEDFLAKHLGGRSGGFDYVEIGAKIF